MLMGEATNLASTFDTGMRGDLDFERLVAEHHAPLYRFAVSLTRDESEASDLVQETFYIWAAKGHQLTNPARVAKPCQIARSR